MFLVFPSPVSAGGNASTQWTLVFNQMGKFDLLGVVEQIQILENLLQVIM